MYVRRAWVERHLGGQEDPVDQPMASELAPAMVATILLSIEPPARDKNCIRVTIGCGGNGALREKSGGAEHAWCRVA